MDLQLHVPMQSVPITTDVLSLNPAHGKVYSIQHYVIKFVSDLQHVGGFLWVVWFIPPIKPTEILLKVASNTITPNPRTRGGQCCFNKRSLHEKNF